MTAGTVLGGRYELRVRLGSGGAGTVWRGFDTTLHREVAVKLITLDSPTGPDPDPIQRFRREARVVAGLNHPNIVAAYDFGTADDVAYLVMELVVGSSVAQRLRTVKAGGAQGIDELTVIRLAQQVCSGLATAHRARLVHRDLKPSNLMLSDATGQVKIVDFGIARVAEQSRLTSTGSYLGTLPYMAPEQMEASPLDGRADLYSLGCLLHELVAGRSAYNASTPMQWMAAHQLGTPARLRSHAPRASAMLEALILQLLAKDANHRPVDADTVAAMLAGIEADLRRPTPPARLEQTTAATPTARSELTVPSVAVSTAGSRSDVTTAPSARRDVTTSATPALADRPAAPIWTPAASASAPPRPTPPAGGPAVPVSPAAGAWQMAAPSSGAPGPAPAPRRRRSRLIVAAVVVVLGLAAAGYEVWPGHGGATDGRSYVPHARDCYPVAWANAVDADVTTIWSVDDRTATVPCTATHAFEVVTVATPSGAVSASPPAPTSSTVETTYQRCADQADAYLGGDWRGAYAWLGVAMPDPSAWRRGAHWSACVLVPTATWEGQLAESRTSLAAGLRGSQPAAIRCIDDRSRPVDCGGPHTREAVGVYRARSAPFPGSADGAAIFQSACALKVAQYLGLKSLTQYHNQAVGYSWYPQAPNQEQWNLGNRSALCTAFAQPTGATMTGSVRGIENAAPSG